MKRDREGDSWQLKGQTNRGCATSKNRTEQTTSKSPGTPGSLAAQGHQRNTLSFTGCHWTHLGYVAVPKVKCPIWRWVPRMAVSSWCLAHQSCRLSCFICHPLTSQRPKTSSEWHIPISTSDLGLKIPYLEQMQSKPQRTSQSWLLLESP